jgi:hypothetical protein
LGSLKSAWILTGIKRCQQGEQQKQFHCLPLFNRGWLHGPMPRNSITSSARASSIAGHIETAPPRRRRAADKS